MRFFFWPPPLPPLPAAARLRLARPEGVTAREVGGECKVKEPGGGPVSLTRVAEFRRDCLFNIQTASLPP